MIRVSLILTSLVFIAAFGVACSDSDSSVTRAPASAPSEVSTKDDSPQEGPIYSPYAGQTHPDSVYWGDSHLHTSYSWDAGLVGDTLGPDAAYRVKLQIQPDTLS